MALLSRQRFFTLWFWFGAPLLMGAFIIAFATGLYLGFAFSALAVIWFWDMGETTCSRCSSYGTLGCGVQGKIIPLFWRKKSMASASPRRIRFHFFFDLLMLGLVHLIYCLEPIFLPILIVWSLGAWWISFGPKQFHRLLFRNKVQPESTKITSLISLPMLISTENQEPCMGKANEVPCADESPP
jgi:hypothetical protein